MMAKKEEPKAHCRTWPVFLRRVICLKVFIAGFICRMRGLHSCGRPATDIRVTIHSHLLSRFVGLFCSLRLLQLFLLI